MSLFWIFAYVQVILFVNAVLEFTRAKKVLIIVPLNTLQNWVLEFERWIPKTTDEYIKTRTFDVFVLNDSCKTIEQREIVVGKSLYNTLKVLLRQENFDLSALVCPSK